MNQAAAVSSLYVSLPLSQIVESKTNPRRTFEPSKLVELAESILTIGILQPITVRPLGELYEVVAGARRVRASRIAEREYIDCHIVELSDEQALEVQIVENSQRVDVHPYEEAAGYKALLERPGYDVAALAAKCGKSESHVYSRLTLLTLIPEVVEAFQQERITAAHANLLARLTPEQQEKAFPQCWPRYYQEDPPLLPARQLSAWIRENLYLPLAEAPFDREDAELLPQAGACPDCPKRTGHNRALFCDYTADEQCTDSGCYQAKVQAHVMRELTSDGQLLRIETGFRPAAARFPHSVQMNQLWPLQEGSPQCDAVKRGIVVHGRAVGSFVSVCTDKQCPLHNPHLASLAAARAREEEAERSRPQPTEEELREAREREEAEAEELRRVRQENEDYERRKREEREAVSRANAEEQEARLKQMEERRKRRAAKLKRIVKHTPESLTAAQLRVLLCALIESRFETSLSLLAQEVLGEDEDDRQGAEQIVAGHLQGLPDKQVSGFAVRLVLGYHRAEPDVDETDYLAEAEAVFLPKLAKKQTAEQSAA